MAVLNFPSNPTVGQTFSGPNNIVWTWDGTAWSGTAGAIGEAPKDGHIYGRQNGAWVQVPGSPLVTVASISESNNDAGA